MKFISVGSDSLYPELFMSIKNSTIKKPSGGLWATPYLCDTYNEWLDFLVDNLETFYRKRMDTNNKAIVFELKSTANILEIKTFHDIEQLIAQYNDGNDWFSFEELASFYDGIYINLTALGQDEEKDFFIYRHLLKYSVNTLLLFNLNCINSYQKASIDFFQDYCCGMTQYSYKINIEPKEYLLVEDENIKDLLEEVYQTLKAYDLKPNPENMGIIAHIIKKIASEKNINSNFVQDLVERKVFNRS